MPNQRTIIVLGSLVVAMTVASGILLLLKPTPTQPGESQLLSSVNASAPAVDSLLFQTEVPATRDRWQAIVIHHSGSPAGSAQDMNRAHAAMGLSGLGYHFVIHNGQGARDGEIYLGYRWQYQVDGAHTAGEGSEWYNKHAVGVCLIGDPERHAPTDAQVRELLWLVKSLQRQYNIPSREVYVLGNDDQHPTNPGRFFPVADFRQQLRD